MKKKLSVLSFLCVLGLFFAACKKGRDQNENKAVTINVALALNEVYKLDLSQYADTDDSAAIITQAADFTISEISTDRATGKYIYSYSMAALPKTGFTGTEKVIINVHEPAGRKHYDQTVITINFTLK